MTGRSYDSINSLDDGIRADQDQGRQGQVQGGCGLQIGNELKARRPLDWLVGNGRALEQLAGQKSCLDE